ncbi:hypothetical protein [Bariatricus sp. SGI.154]|uniref:hypothetical protein n=1 Tax=Bariatricus sp. SGI.154 TaxID=3420549 RepID=UPI003D0017F8
MNFKKMLIYSAKKEKPCRKMNLRGSSLNPNHISNRKNMSIGVMIEQLQAELILSDEERWCV